MSELSKLRNFESVLGARHLMRMAAAQELADARLCEDRRRLEMETARAALSEAVGSWQSSLDTGSFDPETLMGLAAALNARNAELEAAGEQHASAERGTESARLHYAACEARTAQIEKLFRRLRRKVRWRDEERRLSAMEDRLAYQWMQR